MEQEIWKDVLGFEGIYKVSNKARVMSLLKWRGSDSRILVQNISKTGYYVVTLFKPGFNRVYKVHRLIAEAFLPNPENKRTVNHIDGNKLNNTVGNLEWATDLENIRHAFENKLIVTCVGEKQSATKLKEREVLEIYTSSLPRRSLSKIYNISYTAICSIKNGVTWSHLTNHNNEKVCNHFR
jgi:hypothetical protein